MYFAYGLRRKPELSLNARLMRWVIPLAALLDKTNNEAGILEWSICAALCYPLTGAYSSYGRYE